MKTYIKFIITTFFRGLIFVLIIMTCLIFILNILSEIDFFKNTNVGNFFPFYLSFLNTPSMIFEIFPFIFLLSTQLFFIYIVKNNQLDIFTYSGFKNSNLVKIIANFTLVLGIIIIFFFYNISSNLKNLYLGLKSNYTDDDKYLAVITNNGLWIKDKIEDKIVIVNALNLENNYLVNAFITEFNNNYEIIRNIKSKKIDITDNEWIINDALVYIDNVKTNEEIIKIKSNFNYKKIQNLFSNLTALSIKELFELKKSYNMLDYSVTEIDMHIAKLLTLPIFLMLITIFASIIMIYLKKTKNNTYKISLGLFLSVLIYYLSNFSFVLGNTEKISIFISISSPLLALAIINFLMFKEINEK